jgi:hypothetical protein
MSSHPGQKIGLWLYSYILGLVDVNVTFLVIENNCYFCFCSWKNEYFCSFLKLTFNFKRFCLVFLSRTARLGYNATNCFDIHYAIETYHDDYSSHFEIECDQNVKPVISKRCIGSKQTTRETAHVFRNVKQYF